MRFYQGDRVSVEWGDLGIVTDAKGNFYKVVLDFKEDEVLQVGEELTLLMRGDKAPKPPKELKRSELYMEQPAQAEILWEKGFRPIRAKELKPGMTAASYVTLFDFNLNEQIQYVRIEEVHHDPAEYTVVVKHTGEGTVSDMDDDMEVWAKDPQGEEVAYA